MSKRCCATNCFNSQLINKKVQYFGFPKHKDYSREWAKAAGRFDLLDKSLNNIIKYYICSEHFTEDCFADPPRNTILKKRNRPVVVVPIPSIFKNNLTKVVKVNHAEGRTNEAPAKNDKNKITLDDKTYDEEIIDIDDLDDSVELMKEYDKEPVGYIEIDEPDTSVCSQNEEYLTTEPDNSIARLNENKTNEINTEAPDPSNDQNVNLDEIDVLYQCRLCAEFCECNQDMYSIRSITDLDTTAGLKTVSDCIGRLLPNFAEKNNLSEVICIECFSKLKLCFDIINSFEQAQHKLHK